MPLFQRAPDPLLGPMPDLPWAGGAVFNPGTVRTPDGTVHLLFRAIPAGYRKYARADHDPYEGAHGFTDYVSYIGYATAADPAGPFTVHPDPALRPDSPADRFGVEDPRITTLGGTHYVTYTGLRAPAFGDEQGVGIALASTTDFKTYEKHGPIGPDVRDKDAVIFPRLVGGKVLMLHRVVPDIQVVAFEDEGQLRNPGAAFWDRYLDRLDDHVILRPEHPWEGKKIGAGPPPIETPEGWLLVYHGADRAHVYRTGLALLDLDDPRRVIARTAEPVFSPERPWELEGDVPNVVFVQGAVVAGGDLHLYYGGADRVVGHARAPLADVLDHLREVRRTVWRMPQIAMRHTRGAGDDRPDPFPTTPAVAVERLHGGQPVLEPDPAHGWESRVVLNPAAAHVPAGPELDGLLEAWGLGADQAATLRAAGGACALVYRAQGSAFDRHGHKASSLGLAVLTPDLRLVHRFPRPVLAPEAPEHDLGAEDPRLTKVGDRYFLYYTGYRTERAPSEGDGHLEGRVHVCLATTRDFLRWDLHGPVEGDVNDHPNKNAVLLPEPVNGKWVLLHRPLFGPAPFAMHWAEADDPAGPWRSRGVLLKSRRYDDYALSWLGAAGPPEPLGEGRFAAVYHQGHLGWDRRRMYNLSALLLDFTHDEPVRACVEPLLVPTGAAEQAGDPDLGVDNVVFSCANYRVGADLVVPYAGADSRIFGARLRFDDLVATLEAEAARAPAALSA